MPPIQQFVQIYWDRPKLPYGNIFNSWEKLFKIENGCLGTQNESCNLIPEQFLKIHAKNNKYQHKKPEESPSSKSKRPLDDENEDMELDSINQTESKDITEHLQGDFKLCYFAKIPLSSD